MIFDFEEVQSRFITKIGYWNNGSWHNKDFQTGYFNFSFYFDGYKDRRFSGKIKWFKTNKECLQENILWIPSWIEENRYHVEKTFTSAFNTYYSVKKYLKVWEFSDYSMDRIMPGYTKNRFEEDIINEKIIK